MTILLDSRSRGKNKERASSGNGGSSGILLSMDMVSTSSYAVYVKAISLSFVTWTIGYSSFMVIRFVHFYLPFQDKIGHLLHPLIRRAYTVPVQVGSSQQNLSLQVDTGSSDLVRHVFLCTHALPEPSFQVDCIQIMFIVLMCSNEWAFV